jgi:hypothetical protein
MEAKIFWLAHIDTDFIPDIGEFDRPIPHANRPVFSGKSQLEKKPTEATKTIAATFRFATIAVENAHPESAVRLQENQTVCADAKMAVAEAFYLRFAERKKGGPIIDEDKIVASPLNLSEFQCLSWK